MGIHIARIMQEGVNKVTATRIYKVSHEDSNSWKTVVFVRAASQAQARSHVARNKYLVNVATQDDLVIGMRLGVEIQSANEKEGKDNG